MRASATSCWSLIPGIRTRIGGDVGQVLAHVHGAEIEIGEGHKPP